MKKFYYKKEVSQDKTPIALRLERRHTMDINQDGMQQEQSRLSARTASASSLYHLTEAPTIPRVRSREVTKSLSEDILSKSQTKAPKKIVTETDLSSSWLYKTMQASINSRFKSPRKSPVQQTDDLAPVVLQDPNLKPVLVKSSAERTSSCLCHFATMIAISLCTVGFLASIAGIIYMEVFASRNITSLQTSETQVDLSDVVLDSLENLNDLKTLSFDIDENDIKQKPSKGSITVVENNSLSENEGQRGIIGRFLDTRKPYETEVNQYINTTKTKIKFQDGETVIYEVESSDSIEYENSSNIPEDFKNESLEDNLNQTEDNSFKYSRSSEEVIEEKPDEKSETFLDFQFEKEDPFVTESKGVSGIKSPDSAFHGNQLTDELEESRSYNELKSEDESELAKLNGSEKSESGIELTFEKEQSSPVTLNGSELFDLKEFEPETNGAFYDSDKTESIDTIKDSSNEKPVPSGSSKAKDTQESKPIQHEEAISTSVQYVDDHPVKSEHDVDSMVMIVDEPEEVSTMSFISNRNGEVNPSFELSSSRPSVLPTFTRTGSEHPISPKKQVDIKVSLAEAMKHLQVLDANNKLLTSRIKSANPKADSTKKQKQSNVSRKKEDSTLEKMRYLQKVRLMLYEHLQ